MLKNDKHVALLSGILIGACAGMYYLNIYGISIALIFAEMCVLGRFCCSAYTRYFAAVVYGYSRFGLPFRFARFLGWGRSAGNSENIGSGISIPAHQELQNYLQTDTVIDRRTGQTLHKVKAH